VNYAKRAKEILDIEIAGLNRVRESLGDEFGRAAKVLLSCLNAGRKIIVTGVGKNLPIGEKIAATLTSTGSPAVILHANDALHGDLGIVSDGDVVLALSYSGASEELVNLVPALRRRLVKIIAITGVADSALARLSDEVIPIRVEREACPFNMAPTTSTTVTLAVGDALAMVLLEARGFKREDYAKLHPGGAIGRTLLMKVSDIMRTGQRMASVEKSVKVKDALFAMTKARSGAVAIVDTKRKVVGIFTDGDLRRKLATIPDLVEQKIEEIMSKKPRTVRQDDLAVDVLAVFEKHSFDDLIVVDSRGRLAGMIDIQDLPKFKIL
jgi:arabinose-5-phosphate isomerase